MGVGHAFVALCRDADVFDCDIMASGAWTRSCIFVYYDFASSVCFLYHVCPAYEGMILQGFLAR